MTLAAQYIIDSFTTLSKSEQLEVAVEIMRLTRELDFPPVSDEELVFAAEALFLDLDRREAEDERAKQR